MGLPTLQKTWNYDVNEIRDFAAATDIERARALLFYMKEQLVDSGKWAVEASSDATSYKNVGDADPDLWIDKDDLNRGSTTRSWCILYNSTLGVSLCIDMQTSYDYQCDVYLVKGHYNADGLTTSKPTSANTEITYANTSSALGRDGGSTRVVLHSMWSTDGECFRFYAISNGTNPGVAAFILEKPSNAPDGWTNPIIFDWIGDSNDETWPTLARWYTGLNIYAEVNGSIHQMYATGEACADGNEPITQRADCNPSDLDTGGGYLLQPMGLYGKDPGIKGSNGRLTDIWWRPIEMAIFDTLPDDGTRQFIAVGKVIWPWNGSVPVWG